MLDDLVQAGADLGEVSDALGHAGLEMTRRYAHLSKGETAKRLGGIMDRLMDKGSGAEPRLMTRRLETAIQTLIDD